DRNRSHWSTSKTPSYTKSVSWQHHQPYLGNMLNDFAGVDQQRVMHCRKAFSDAKVFK
ncbi:hypothetical protein U4Z67_22140, partial [Escherichia coli]|nr:hypothetical protein [Escherichia coli]